MRVELNVSGMRCGKCVDKIEKFVGEIEGISLVDVNLQDSKVIVEFDSPVHRSLSQKLFLM